MRRSKPERRAERSRRGPCRPSSLATAAAASCAPGPAGASSRTAGTDAAPRGANRPAPRPAPGARGPRSSPPPPRHARPPRLAGAVRLRSSSLARFSRFATREGSARIARRSAASASGHALCRSWISRGQLGRPGEGGIQPLGLGKQRERLLVRALAPALEVDLRLPPAVDRRGSGSPPESAATLGVGSSGAPRTRARAHREAPAFRRAPAPRRAPEIGRVVRAPSARRRTPPSGWPRAAKDCGGPAAARLPDPDRRSDSSLAPRSGSSQRRFASAVRASTRSGSAASAPRYARIAAAGRPARVSTAPSARYASV